MKSLITLLALTSAQSFALDAFYLPYTKHLAPCYEQCINGEYREDNHVTGITNGKYSAFIMRNSHDKFSVFAGKQWTRDLTSNIRTFATIGGVTGYSDVSSSIAGVSFGAYAGLDIHPTDSKWGIVITGVPTKEGVLNFGFRLTL